MLPTTFEHPSAFDCLAFVLESLPKTPNIWSVEVLLETTPDEARRAVPPALASLEQVSGGVILRCYVEHLDWIARILVSIGCPFVVHQPPELRDELRLLAQHISTLAERDQ
ncbi:MAG: hypothetical protein NVS2B12_23670 [Ktedonobacteraceae bacterium]